MRLFSDFVDIELLQRHVTRDDIPRLARWMPAAALTSAFGWNLVIKARKPSAH